ncbi:regulatory protein GemA [Oceanibaculum indicum]|uniref:Mu-like prophage protein gp16 n=1 Tax=Oceanibaculum indicum P24 TaxID=1207063 RepID=K2K6F0_9PROT|nr:regulatory protein GemA [Oceanibaculum indicum]EKE78449.1 Mu-like prophage protein gp16 [Oceanibaculum indicum P24]
MTAASKINPKTFGAIHASRKQIAGLADDTAWRALLVRVTGKDSLRTMTGPQLGKVIDELHRQGARKTPPKRAFKGRTRKLADSDQAQKIRALWLALWHLGCIADSSEEALAAFVKRQAKVDALEWLPADKAAGVIEALKGWLARPAGKGGGGVSWSSQPPISDRQAVVEAQWRRLLDLDAIAQPHIGWWDMAYRMRAAPAAPQFYSTKDWDSVIAVYGRFIRKALAKAQAGRKDADG